MYHSTTRNINTICILLTISSFIKITIHNIILIINVLSRLIIEFYSEINLPVFCRTYFESSQ